MQLNYELTPKSYIKGLLQANLIFSKWTLKSHLIRALLIFPFICFILWWWITFFEQQSVILEILGDDYGETLDEFLNDVKQTNRWLVISAVILAIVAGVKPYIEMALHRIKAFEHYYALLMNNRIELREKELFHQSDMGSSLSLYEKFYAVEQSKDFVLIFFDRGAVSHVIPKSAFGGQAQIDEFLAIIRSKMSQKNTKNNRL
ncbi:MULTISPECIES: YcxB family protein [unclassified Mannheimia]|uniref:YcxB family protein n=1 Tax=unclassified Mannheimia TaxID=2645054 RepID=UPI00359EA4BC